MQKPDGIFKLTHTFEEEQVKGGLNKRSTFSPSMPDGLIGEANEAPILITSHPCTALLDTGSTVSTMSDTFYSDHLSHIEVFPLVDFLNIECADGQCLPYSGYIEVDVVLKGVFDKPMTCLFLIVPESRYNSKVPILLGTNVLSPALDDCRTQYGDRFLQIANIHTPWYLAFRSILLQDRGLLKSKGRLGFIRSA